MRAHGCCLLTAVRVTSCAARPAASAARTMRARMSARAAAESKVSDGMDEAGSVGWEALHDVARRLKASANPRVRPQRDLPALLFFTDPGRTPHPCGSRPAIRQG